MGGVRTARPSGCVLGSRRSSVTGAPLGVVQSACLVSIRRNPLRSYSALAACEWSVTSSSRSRSLATAHRIVARISAVAMPLRQAAGVTKRRLSSAALWLTVLNDGWRRRAWPTIEPSLAATQRWMAPDGVSHRAGSARRRTRAPRRAPQRSRPGRQALGSEYRCLALAPAVVTPNQAFLAMYTWPRYSRASPRYQFLS